MQDPIVEEVREAGDRIAQQCDYDLHTLCERLRRTEQEFAERLVDPKDLERRRERA